VLFVYLSKIDWVLINSVMFLQVLETTKMSLFRKGKKNCVFVCF